jgi:hypothetical protein
MDQLSDRDRTKIRNEIAEKLVDKICSGLINNAPLVDNLRESLGNEMLNVLNDPANKSKISQTVLQAINTSLSLPLRGPLLLYALMDHDESYEYTKNMITFIFGQIYKENDTLSKFSGNLVESLYDPPYDSWFKEVNNMSGGKKRKTKRKISKKRRNKMKSRRKYSRKRKIYGGSGGIAGAATEAVTGAATEAVTGAEGGVTDAATEAVTGAEGGVTDAAAAATTSALTEAGAEGDDKDAEEEEGDAEEEEEDEDGDGEEEKQGDSNTPPPTSISTASSDSSGSSSAVASMFSQGAPKREMTGSEITQNANELVSKYNEALFNLISKDLETVKSQILQRMLNACYLHATNNSNVILTAITNSIGNIVQQSMNTGVLQYDYPNFIILVQAMRPSNKDIVNALGDTYMNQKQKASNEGKKDEVPFKPNDTQFIVDFMSNFKNAVSKKINLDLTSSK